MRNFGCIRRPRSPEPRRAQGPARKGARDGPATSYMARYTELFRLVSAHRSLRCMAAESVNESQAFFPTRRTLGRAGRWCPLLPRAFPPGSCPACNMTQSCTGAASPCICFRQAHHLCARSWPYPRLTCRRRCYSQLRFKYQVFGLMQAEQLLERGQASIVHLSYCLSASARWLRGCLCTGLRPRHETTIGKGSCMRRIFGYILYDADITRSPKCLGFIRIIIFYPLRIPFLCPCVAFPLQNHAVST